MAFLVDDGINGHGRFTGLAVTNDQLTLTTANRHHRVNRLDTGLQRLVHRLASDHARGDFFDHVGHLGVDRAFAVNRLTQSVHHTANQLRADGHFQDAAGAFHNSTFGDVLVRAQNHGTHRVTLQVQRQPKRGLAIGISREFEHLALHHIRQAVHAHDTVGHRHHSALITDIAASFQPLDAALNQFRNFCGIELHDSFLLPLS